MPLKNKAGGCNCFAGSRLSTIARLTKPCPKSAFDMDSKKLFQKKKDLRQWWQTITDNPNFSEVLLHARSEFIEMQPGVEGLAGARSYETILLSLAEGEEGGSEIPGSGRRSTSIR